MPKIQKLDGFEQLNKVKTINVIQTARQPIIERDLVSPELRIK